MRLIFRAVLVLAMRRAFLVGFALLATFPTLADDLPALDTETGEIGSTQVGSGFFHPMLTVDVRNGDFTRGAYDDDAADFEQVPLHLQFGLGVELHRNEIGDPDATLLFVSSNGFHEARPKEFASPHDWYESNNLVGLVVSPADGLQTALSFTVKSSPNDVAETTYELNLAAEYMQDTGLAWLHPSAVATVRPNKGDGAYTQVGLEPEFDLTDGEDGPAISVPLRFGVGWSDFYEPDTGDLAFGSVGLAYSYPFETGGVKWQFHAEALALIRDKGLRLLDPAPEDRDTVVPYATISLTVAY